MIEAFDRLGALIEPGDTIVYPGRWSSSLWLNVAVVDEVVSYQRGRPGYPQLSVGKFKVTRPDDKKVTIGNPYRIAVIAKKAS